MLKQVQEIIPAFIKDFCKAFPLIINKKQVVSFNYHNSMSDHPNNEKSINTNNLLKTCYI